MKVILLARAYITSWLESIQTPGSNITGWIYQQYIAEYHLQVLIKSREFQMTKDPLSLGLVSKVLAGYWHWRPSYWTCPSSASSRPLPPSGCWTGQTPAWCPATWRWSSSREWWRSPGPTPENHSWDADQRIINLWPWEYPWYGLLYKHWTTTVKSLYNSNCLHPPLSTLLPSPFPGWFGNL